MFLNREHVLTFMNPWTSRFDRWQKRSDGVTNPIWHVSADTITNERGESFFLIRLRTERNYLGTKANSLPIISGMTVNVDILTGRKTLLDYLLKPIKKAQEQALRER